MEESREAKRRPRVNVVSPDPCHVERFPIDEMRATRREAGGLSISWETKDQPFARRSPG